MPLSVQITKVELKNYKSIHACQVDLPPLCCLVGPNGAGKSNFVDALRFVADALRNGVDGALRERGGIDEVRRRSHGRPNHFQIGLEVRCSPHTTFRYSFEVAAKPGNGFAIQQEMAESVSAIGDPAMQARFRAESGSFTRWEGMPGGSEIRHPGPDRLFLGMAWGPFHHLRSLLLELGFCNINPDRIRDLQSPDPGELLLRDGANLASVLSRLARGNKAVASRIDQFLAGVVPGVDGVTVKALGPKETLEFLQRTPEGKATKFLAASMSDGTLRALGVLVGLFHLPVGGYQFPLVAIEEPEVALHPAAAGVLFDALREAAEMRQVLITSHSPDLLDLWQDIPDALLAAEMEAGKTLISPITPASRESIEKKLRTPGDLLRMNRLKPDRSRIPRPERLQLHLFGAQRCTSFLSPRSWRATAKFARFQHCSTDWQPTLRPARD
ncbi:MAG: AAA family ATPase [Bryobacterales bacterium]|jgi:predicted ATPase|nr:AAA family ATPase [Bryobacterales bacterium]